MEQQNEQTKSVAMILTFSELKEKIDEAGGMMELIEQMKAGGHTHIGLLPDNWKDKIAVPPEDAWKETVQVVMGIDPGSDSMAIRRFLIEQRGIRGAESPIFHIDDAGFFPLEHTKRDLDMRVKILDGEYQFRLPVPEMPQEVYAVLAEEDAEPDATKNKGPRRRSKYQRGGWWNR